MGDLIDLATERRKRRDYREGSRLRSFAGVPVVAVPGMGTKVWLRDLTQLALPINASASPSATTETEAPT